MKCAVALVLAILGLAVANPVPSLGLGVGLASPVILPSYSIASNYVNHGYAIPRVVVSAPIVRHVVSAPIVTAPIIRTPVIAAPVSVGWPGWGWGSSYGWGKGWH